MSSGALDLMPTSGCLRPDDQIDLTVKYLKQRQDLVDRLAVVRLVEKPIQLRRRSAEPPHDLALGQRGFGNSLLCFERQSVQQQIAVVGRIVVVLVELWHMGCGCPTGVMDVRKRLRPRVR